MLDALEVYQVCNLLLSDRPVKSVDAVLFYSRSFEDDDNLFELAAEYYLKGLTGAVVINGFDGYSEHDKTKKISPGRDEYVRRLTALGVDNIVESAPAFQTRQENSVFLDVLRERRWRSVATLAHPQQLLREVLGFLQEMKKVNYWASVYSLTPTSTDYSKPIQASQGEFRDSREDDIEVEYNKVITYQDKGNLVTLAELKIYLRARRRLDNINQALQTNPFLP